MRTLNRPDLSDIHPGDWVDRRLPPAWRPFTRLARLDRPVGIWLTLFPCWAALIQASHGFPDPRQLGIFSLGALLMRSAGATVNDIADRKFDGHVERTAFGPWQTVRSARYTPLSFWPFSLHLRPLSCSF